MEADVNGFVVAVVEVRVCEHRAETEEVEGVGGKEDVVNKNMGKARGSWSDTSKGGGRGPGVATVKNKEGHVGGVGED